uniref:Transferase n=1 Tax=Rubia yunnanensis TaxID=1650721 RepID=A0A896AHV1_9GENT|nr:transferase [Rubia yunnanensis]
MRGSHHHHHHGMASELALMQTPDLNLHSSTMVKYTNGRKNLPRNFLYAGGIFFAGLALWVVCSSFSVPNPTHINSTRALNTDGEGNPCDGEAQARGYDPPEPTFYDDPELSYTIEKTVKNWDEKRQDWLKKHPGFAAGAAKRVVMLTGSQATPCKNPIGDHLLLRFFKNKVDYCRIHGYELFYNTVLLQPQMWSFWAKTPVVKAAMLAHPEAEWIWWVDSDAAFTDMDFTLPFDRYKDHNMVIHGWPRLINEEKSWTGLNAGVFLIRNCQWAMDFMEKWASMGPQSPEYEKWGEIQRSTFKDKSFPESDDQTGLAYLILTEKEKFGNKIYVEGQFYFEGYWMEIVGTYTNITDMYTGIEKREKKLRRRHAEKVSESYANLWEEPLKNAGYGRGSWRRPFMTHFTGCQPCSGDHNQMYSGQSCWDAMQAALNFADNQVLRTYGFVHKDLWDTATVMPLPFDHPAAAAEAEQKDG